MGKKNKRSKKQKVQRRIAKWISDGRISKSEARKAQRQGISLNRIQKAQTKRYTRPQSVFAPKPSPLAIASTRRKQDAPQPKPAARPAYRPLIIKEGASRTFNTAPQRTAGGGTPVMSHVDAIPPQHPPVEPEIIEDEGPSVEDMFAETIAGMQAQYEQSLAMQQQQFAAMEAQQQQQMMALQTQMQSQQNAMSAAAQMAGRPSVLGVQGAVSSAGTPMQIARRGPSGSFGRGGMRIQSLNV